MPASQLPFFRYHPDPIRTGNIVPGDGLCRSCGLARGFVYTGPCYAEAELQDAFCPWCIADGSAARKFDAEFSDPFELERAGIQPDTIDEILRRTPGYIAWQTTRWLSHCSDACEFHGDLPRQLLASLTEEEKAQILDELPDTDWNDILENYEPAGQPAIYWFVCRQCRKNLYYADFT